MGNLRYNLKADGKMGSVGYEESFQYEADGTEPWYDTWATTAANYKWTGLAWEVWVDVLTYSTPATRLKQALSDVPVAPNIGRDAYVAFLGFDLNLELILYKLLIRHYRKSNLKELLEYDQLLDIDVGNDYLIEDPITLEDTGAWDLFRLRLKRDDEDIDDVTREFIVYFDEKGTIDDLIEIY